MRGKIVILIALSMILFGCSTAYKAKPLPFKAPSSYENAIKLDGTVVAARAYSDPKKAEEAFGFDVRGAGFLPVEVIFDNDGPHSWKVVPGQTFLEDEEANLWPILDEKTAYDRATKYSQTKQIFKGGAYGGFLGATAGAVLGAAIGIVTGQGVGESLGRGAAMGAAAGATIGGAQGYAGGDEARHTIIADLNNKSLENKPISQGLSFGFLFFPGEAKSAKQLRMQLLDTNTGRVFAVTMGL